MGSDVHVLERPRRLDGDVHRPGLVGSEFVVVFLVVIVLMVVLVVIVFIVFFIVLVFIVVNQVFGVKIDLRVDGKVDETVHRVGGFEVGVERGPNLGSPQRPSLIRSLRGAVDDVVVEGRELGLDVADEASALHALTKVTPGLRRLERRHHLISLVERVHAGGVGDKRVETRKLRLRLVPTGHRLEAGELRVCVDVGLPELRDETREFSLILQTRHREDDDVAGDVRVVRGKLGEVHGAHRRDFLVLDGGDGAVVVAPDVVNRDVEVTRQRFAHDVDVDHAGIRGIGTVTRDDHAADEDKVRLDECDVVVRDAGGGADVVTLDDRGERGEDVVADVLPRGVHGHLDGGPDVGLEIAVAE